MSQAAIKQTLVLNVGQVYWFAPVCTTTAPYTETGLPTMANERSTYLDVYEHYLDL